MSGPVVLRLAGEVDIAVVGPLREAWYATAERDAPAVIVVDLAEVTFMDACGLGLLVRVRERQLRHGGELRLRSVPPCVLTLMQLTGLLRVFPNEDRAPADADGRRAAPRAGPHRL